MRFGITSIDGYDQIFPNAMVSLRYGVVCVIDQDGDLHWFDKGEWTGLSVDTLQPVVGCPGP